MANKEDPLDDIFDEQSDVNLGDKEWNRLKSSLTKDGMRDGVYEGQEMMLQSGFNAGFKHAAELAQQMAQLRGFLSALVGYNMTRGSVLVPDDVSEQLKDLLEKTSQLEARFSSLKPKQEKNQAQASQNIDTSESGLEGHEHKNEKAMKEERDKMESDCGLESDVVAKGDTVEPMPVKSCDCGATDDSCCKSGNSDAGICIHGQCHGNKGKTMTEVGGDLPKNLSHEYLNECEDITQKLKLLNQESAEIFQRIQFNY